MYGDVIVNYGSVVEEIDHLPTTRIVEIVIMGALMDGALLAVGIF